MNSVSLTGRLTRDIEVRYTNDELAIGTFDIATPRDRSKNDKNDDVDFVRIKCFGKTAEFLQKWTGKGLWVAVHGRLRVDKYEKNGENRTFYEVVADRVEPIEWKKQEDPGFYF